MLGLDTYHNYDTAIPLVDFDRKYPYERRAGMAAGVGRAARRRVSAADARRARRADWIDVYENPGKRSGAYSAPVYGVHPYMLLNYNDTLDAVFTLAHEMGHSMHTILSNAHQPFVYSAYTIFVAEVPSTLSEMLFLDYMLAHATDDRERIVLLQHAIDGIVGTFYTQVLFADYELQAHRLVEEGRPVTADGLERDLLRPAEGVLRRRARLRRAVADHLGAHPALLQHAVLRLPVRDLLRVERAADEAADDRIGGRARGRDRPLPDAAEVRRQRSPDAAAAARRRRSQQAGDGARRRRSAGRAGDAAGNGDRSSASLKCEV